MFLTATEAVYVLQKPLLPAQHLDKFAISAKDKPIEQTPPAVVRLKMDGANPNPQVKGLDELPGKSNYFIGNDPAKWQTNVTSYERVELKEIYPGIDLTYYGNQGQLEYDFIVSRNADPKQIRLSFEGVNRIVVNDNGELLLDLEGETIVQKAPQIYQEIDGGRKVVTGSYQITGGQIGFLLGDYDRSKPLVIDPVLVYSTYLGGNGREDATGIAVDKDGNVYVTGDTTSTNYPTSSPIQGSYGGNYDVFVSKISSSGSALVYSTYLGGSAEDTGYALAVDASGAVFVSGNSASGNFPV
jgi:hypothetical protein